MRHRKAVTEGRALLVLIAFIALATAVGVLGFIVWYALQHDTKVTAYLKIHRSPASAIFQSPPSLSDYKFSRGNHEALLTSPMVIETALQLQGIADLDVVRRQEDPAEWLTNELVISFPGDGEILQVSMECDDQDVDGVIRIVDGVINAYIDKVLFLDRLQESALRSDLEFIISEMDQRLKEDLRKVYAASDPDNAPEEKAQAALLKDDCRAARDVRDALIAKKRELGLEIMLREQAERRGTIRSGEVEVLQRATPDYN